MAAAHSAIPRRLQDLPPRQAGLCLAIEKFFLEIVAPGRLSGLRLVVGFSHGVDSTALLLLLNYLAPRQRLSLLACHLDHGLRPSSAEEAARAEAFCRSLGLDYFGERADVRALARQGRIGLEQAGREARYEFFERVRRASGAALIVLGHQAMDLCEDVLLRLTRGTGWPGLGGMAAYDPKRRLARPLLLTPKKRLEEFLRELGADCVRDASNESDDFLRNRIRSAVLPKLAQENPNLSGAIARLWRLARLDADYWEEAVGACLPPHDPEIAAAVIVLEAAALRAAPPALRLRLYKAALDRLGPGESRAETVFELDEAFERGRLGSALQFPGGKRAVITAAGVTFHAAERSEDEPGPLRD